MFPRRQQLGLGRPPGGALRHSEATPRHVIELNSGLSLLF